MELISLSRKSKKLLKQLIKVHKKDYKFNYQTTREKWKLIEELINTKCLVLHVGPITETDSQDVACVLSLTTIGTNYFKTKSINRWKFFLTSILLPILTSAATTIIIYLLGLN